MINVNNDTIQAWLSDRKVNTVTISFPQISKTYGIDDIDCDSFSLKESLCNADEMEFVGCIASSLKVSIFNIPNNVKGKRVTVTMRAGSTERIQVFSGIVDSVEIDSDSKFKTIIAYDDLYTAGQVDVAEWYARLSLPMTLGAIRQSLMSYVGLTEVSGTSLPNDDVTIYRTLENPDTIQALTVIKSICQINGACGIINRQGKFEYRYVQTSSQTSFHLSFHESLKYEEFFCRAIQRVQIRDQEEDAGVVTSSAGNKYIVQGNMFAYELATDVLKTMASNILAKVNGFTYHPMRSIQNGLPFLEVGDTIEYDVSSEGYGVDTFLILSRTISGIQFCRDAFESRGVQDQSEYISDIQAQVDVLKRTTNELKNLTSKIVDYILPFEIEESDIDDGEYSDVLVFQFFVSAEDEKSSFYSSVNFEIETAVDSVLNVYGDCTLTVSYILDGTTVEVQTHCSGDGDFMLMMNYLLTELQVGNHTFVVRFSMSGGSLSSLQVISAYLLAATAVDSGQYSDDYEIDDDEDFAEYMDDIDEGEYIELVPPNNRIGTFSGNQFCDDWYAAFLRPIEYANIYNIKKSYSQIYPDINKPAEWTNYVDRNTTTLIPVVLDNKVNTATTKHANFWLASICLKTDSPAGAQGYKGLGLTGVYMPPGVTFQILENFPTLGYARFSFSNKQGTVEIPAFQSNYNWQRRTYNDSDFPANQYYMNIKNGYLLVYNVEVFKAYLNRLDASALYDLLNDRLFALAECNVKKEWHKVT